LARNQLVNSILWEALEGFRPDPDLTVSEWADKYRRLPSKGGSEPGQWRTERTPYLKEIMDTLSPGSGYEKIIFMKGAQIGGTECGVNWIGFCIHLSPGPILIVHPTVDLAKKFSKQRLESMIRDTRAIKIKMAGEGKKDPTDTVLYKEFEGGVLTLTGANSPTGLRQMPARYLFLDDVDAYEADIGGEGDPVVLTEKRASTFARRKILIISTPTNRERTRIAPFYEESDRRVYQVPCPFCDHYQRIVWDNIRWEKEGEKHRPETARLKCEGCGELIEERYKTQMLERGKWVKTNPGSKIAGFHLSALYGPLGWKSWGEIARDFLKAQGNLAKQKSWTNTELGEVWEDERETVETDPLLKRREKYGPDIPMEAGILTAAVDIQRDRLEAEVVAWGRGEESWSMDYQTFYGSPILAQVWKDLDLYLDQQWKHESGGIFKIACTCIDSGDHTKEVYAFVKPRQGRRVFAVKGSSQHGHGLVGRPTVTDYLRIKLFPVGTDTAKDTIFARLIIEDFGPGYMHFPMDRDEEYFRQLTAEERTTRWQKGVPIQYWKRIRPRNEALDLRVYNMAALAILNVDLDQLIGLIERSMKEGRPLPPEPGLPRRRMISKGVG